MVRPTHIQPVFTPAWRRPLLFSWLLIIPGLGCGRTGDLPFSEPTEASRVDGAGGADAAASCGAEDRACCPDLSCADPDGDERLACYHGVCRSREWALWPMPNPPDTDLPHRASYSVLENTVLDNITGLVWQRKASGEMFDWEGARSHCRALRLDGKSFRLPTRIELTSLMQFTRAEPAFDDEVFSGVPPSQEGLSWSWTSSEAVDPHDAFAVDVTLGTSTVRSKSITSYAWCVARSKP